MIFLLPRFSSKILLVFLKKLLFSKFKFNFRLLFVSTFWGGVFFLMLTKRGRKKDQNRIVILKSQVLSMKVQCWFYCAEYCLLFIWHMCVHTNVLCADDNVMFTSVYFLCSTILYVKCVLLSSKRGENVKFSKLVLMITKGVLCI